MWSMAHLAAVPFALSCKPGNLGLPLRPWLLFLREAAPLVVACLRLVLVVSAGQGIGVDRPGTSARWGRRRILHAGVCLLSIGTAVRHSASIRLNGRLCA